MACLLASAVPYAGLGLGGGGVGVMVSKEAGQMTYHAMGTVSIAGQAGIVRVCSR